MLHGNWSGLTRKLENFQNDLEDTLRETIAQSGEYVESTVLGHLKNQDLNWEPLKLAYLQRKLRGKGKASRSLSEKILIATGTYFQSITTYIERFTAFIGVKRGVAKEADGTDILNLAEVHEFGAPAANIPARPLWKPTFDECQPKILQMFKSALRQLLRT